MLVTLLTAMLVQAATVAPTAPPAPAAPVVTVPPVRDAITEAEAAAMVTACERLAAKSGWAMQIAILNNSGELIRFTKMDGARRTSAFIAQRKAESAFKTGRTTRDLGANPTAAAPLLGLFTAAGGVPIVRNGLLAGAIGVSGGTADQDEQCAVAAIATLK